MTQPKAIKLPAEGWRDLRDGDGKLCARIDERRLLLEIRRSDRKQVAQFDLRDYVEQLRALDIKLKPE